MTNDTKSMRIIEELLVSAKGVLIPRFNAVFISHAFENDHTVAVRRLSEIAAEEYDFFLDFVRSGDTAVAASHGVSRVTEGICIESILDMMSTLVQFYIETVETPNRYVLIEMLHLIAVYAKAYIKGYSDTSPKKILKQQQEIRQALSAALQGQQNELFIRNYSIDSSINAILLAGLDGNPLYVNPAFLEMWDLESLHDVPQIQQIDQICGEEVARIFESLKETKKWRGELVVKRRDKKKFDVEMLASLIIDDHNHIYGSMASFVDITERKRVELQLRRAQKMDALGQLAAGITHDFNNMFAVVKGFIQLILRDLDKNTQIYEDVNQIKVAIERSSGLTKQLQYFARGVGGEYVTLNLNDIIKESYEILRYTITPDIELGLELEHDIGLIDADPSQISHVIINFCVNARDAIMKRFRLKFDEGNYERQDGKITIETRNIVLDEQAANLFLKAAPGRYIRMTVSDNGTGISQDVMERLFEPFYSTKKSKKHSGLGLSIIYGIIEKLGGFIDVKSEPGNGSAFNVYLPASKHAELEPVKRDSEPTFTKEARTVLLVDDEEQLLEVMSRFLRDYHYDVITAKNGKDAVAIYAEHHHRIQLVVLDMIMPGMDGAKSLKQILRINPAAKVIIITGFTTDETVYEMARNKVVEIIEKPFDLRKLTRAIRNALRIDAASWVD